MQEQLGHRFADPALLVRALTHPSVSADPSHRGGDYERLEFLGDRVLGLVVAEMLFNRFPEEAEGLLARRLAKLVGKDTLASVAEDLDLGNVMRFAMGEDEKQGRSNPGLLSDACEAVIAALYLDGGLPVAQAFIVQAWRKRIEEDREPPSDAKTELQEWAQGRGLPLPRYSEVDRQGPPHDPLFTIRVEVEEMPPQTGTGRSKRAAEQDAAAQLLSLVKEKRR
ncbi:ribonuclease III [Pelagibius marinus]|uniref:ribonuclease III n=1 Tax=Pelagibius marinus TaxID=2762760 RepID=UPI001D03C497|nr:ribonuclease III [Pelagibius marinus]